MEAQGQEVVAGEEELAVKGEGEEKVVEEEVVWRK